MFKIRSKGANKSQGWLRKVNGIQRGQIDQGGSRGNGGHGSIPDFDHCMVLF